MANKFHVWREKKHDICILICEPIKIWSPSHWKISLISKGVTYQHPVRIGRYLTFICTWFSHDWLQKTTCFTTNWKQLMWSYLFKLNFSHWIWPYNNWVLSRGRYFDRNVGTCSGWTHFILEVKTKICSHPSRKETKTHRGLPIQPWFTPMFSPKIP